VNEKRSFTLAGHRTSLALEAEFWQVLEEIAEDRSLSLAALVKEIDSARRTENLASACRLAALGFYRGHSGDGKAGI